MKDVVVCGNGTLATALIGDSDTTRKVLRKTVVNITTTADFVDRKVLKSPTCPTELSKRISVLGTPKGRTFFNVPRDKSAHDSVVLEPALCVADTEACDARHFDISSLVFLIRGFCDDHVVNGFSP